MSIGPASEVHARAADLSHAERGAHPRRAAGTPPGVDGGGSGVLAEELQQRLARITLDRIRVGLWLLTASSVLFITADLWLAGENAGIFIVLDLIQLGALAIAFVVLRRRPGLRVSLVVGFGVASVLLVCAATYGVLEGDVLTMPQLGVVFTLASAALVPWGWPTQALLVGMTVVAGAANLYAVTGSLLPVFTYPGLAMLFAGTVSVFLARQVRANVTLQESESFAFGVLDSLSARIAILDPAGSILVANRAWHDLADRGAAGIDGLQEGADLSAACRDGNDASLVAIAAAIERVSSEGGIEEVPLHPVRLPSATRWCVVRVTRLETSIGRRIVLAMEDCTELQRRSEEIHRLNEELERRIRERTTELEIANRELESFSYSVSHDLRAPLRSIDGFSQILLEDHAGRLDIEGRSYLQRVRASVSQMQDLLGDFLNLARVTRQEMHRGAVDLTAMATSVAEELRAREPDRRVELAVAGGMAANADPRLIRLALVSLLENSWKFSRPRATAHIEVGATERDGETIFHVRDDGVGFDMAHAGKLFQAFKRLHGAGEFEGNGVGLAIVERIVERHGGRIWAESAPGEGATFYFTL